jgi:formylglycine-generating enzyme required for sulfatase activity
MRHHQIEDPVAFYRSARARSRELFDLVAPDAYYDRPIRLRNPIVFYEGHLAAFAVNTLLKLTLQRPGLDEHYETLFARGIDPEDEASAKSPMDLWPSRAEVQAYAVAAEELIVATLRELPDHEATFTVLEHEVMHQETLLYMFHELPYATKRRAGFSLPPPGGQAEARPTLVTVPAGMAHLGQTPPCFGWDNEFSAHSLHVPEFSIGAYNVTNGEYLQFIEATGAKAPHFWVMQDGEWYWRGMFALTALPLGAPVYVTHDEATAYATWKGARLPTEAEFDRAAYGAAQTQEGNFDAQHWDPVPAGSYAPNGFGIHDLIGNGWEWTSSLFAPFDGFEPMPSYPQYSVDFFDGAHYVLKGASPATARALVRRSFRNWFRPSYPYVYATFRCAR